MSGPRSQSLIKKPAALAKDRWTLTGQNFDNFWPDGRGKKSRTRWLQNAEFPDARNQLELLDRLFPRKTTNGAPNQRRRFVGWFPASALVQTPA
jgi:hypothetical protein